MPDRNLYGHAGTGTGGPWGMVPYVPDPTDTANQAITGDLANLPGLQNLAGQINQFNTGQAIAPYIANLPGYQDMVGQSSQNILSQLHGQLPQDVVDLLGQQSAERGIMQGIPGGPNTNAAYMRGLGLTSLGQQQQGESNLTSAIQRTPVPQLFNVASFLTSPEDMQAAQMAANLYAAAPDPTQQANALMALLREAMGGNQGRGGGQGSVSFPPPSGGWGAPHAQLPGSGGSDRVGGGGGQPGYQAAPPDPNASLYPITGRPPVGGASGPGGVGTSIFGGGGLGSIYGAGGMADPLRQGGQGFNFGNLFGGGGAQGNPFSSLFGGQGGIGDIFSAGGGGDPFANQSQSFNWGDLFGSQGLGDLFGSGGLSDPFSPGNQTFNFGDLFGSFGTGDIFGAGGLGDPLRNAGQAVDPWANMPWADFEDAYWNDLGGGGSSFGDIGDLFGAGGFNDPFMQGNDFGAPIGAGITDQGSPDYFDQWYSDFFGEEP